VGVIERARLEPVGLTVASLAGVGAVMTSNRQRSGPLLIIDIGADWTDIAVVDDGRLIASRSVELAGKKLTEALARDLDVDLAEAEHLKISRGIGISMVTSDAGANQGSSVEEWIEGISLEIRRSVVAVMASGLSEPLQTAILIGGNAQVPMLADTLGSRTGLRVEIGDPWEGMLLSDVASYTQQELSATFAVATGAALMGLDAVDFANLLPRNRVEMRQRKRREAATVLGLVAIIMVLLTMFISGQRSLSARSKQLHRVTSKINQVERELRSLPPNTATAAIAVRETIASIEREHTSPIELLRVLSVNLPRSIWLTEFSFDVQKSVVLKGNALSNSVVADTIDVLNELGIFESVDLDYSNIV
ncbi:MAG: pilus assembly protein PilM, partial [Armatimonadetes bacterium]|nr:pilus assembly protein PilM [Armatimonadota bacterium]